MDGDKRSLLNSGFAGFHMKHKPRAPKKPDGPLAVEEQRSRNALRYSSFHIQDFRGIRELTVEPLPRLNLITGENNSGKTALLEAIFLHSTAFNPMAVTTVAGLRGIGAYKIEFGRMVQPPWSSLFSDLDESRQIRLSGRDESGHTGTLAINTTTDPKDVAHVRSTSTHSIPNGQSTASLSTRTEILRWHYSGGGREEVSLLFLDGSELKTYPVAARAPIYPGRFIPSRWVPNFVEIADQFGELEIEKREKDLIDILRLIEPRLIRLSTILYGGMPMLHADIGFGKLLPVAFIGDGLLRLTSIILWIIHTAGGVLLIDEVDNGFHYAHLRQIWAAIAQSAKQFNVQVFATTHSKECIIAAHSASSQSFDYDFRLHRMEQVDTGIRAVTYDKEALEAAIDTGFEVR